MAERTGVGIFEVRREMQSPAAGRFAEHMGSVANGSDRFRVVRSWDGQTGCAELATEAL